MPFGGGTLVPNARTQQHLRDQGIVLEPDPARGWGPARYLRGHDLRSGASGRVGFIGALTENFCDGCNRCRITARGDFQACLGGRDRAPLGDLLRGGATDGELEAAVRAALDRKDDRHHMDAEGAGLVLLPMMGIGG
jgi:cyclic pyranopterin phosphate synthase